MIVFKKLPEPLNLDVSTILGYIPETDDKSTISNLIFFDEEIYFPTYQKGGEHIYLHDFSIFFGTIHNDPSYKIHVNNLSEVITIGRKLTYEDVLSHFEGIFTRLTSDSDEELILCDGHLFNRNNSYISFNLKESTYIRKK